MNTLHRPCLAQTDKKYMQLAWGKLANTLYKGCLAGLFNQFTASSVNFDVLALQIINWLCLLSYFISPSVSIHLTKTATIIKTTDFDSAFAKVLLKVLLLLLVWIYHFPIKFTLNFDIIANHLQSTCWCPLRSILPTSQPNSKWWWCYWRRRVLSVGWLLSRSTITGCKQSTVSGDSSDSTIACCHILCHILRMADEPYRCSLHIDASFSVSYCVSAAVGTNTLLYLWPLFSWPRESSVFGVEKKCRAAEVLANGHEISIEQVAVVMNKSMATLETVKATSLFPFLCFDDYCQPLKVTAYPFARSLSSLSSPHHWLCDLQK